MAVVTDRPFVFSPKYRFLRVLLQLYQSSHRSRLDLNLVQIDVLTLR